MLPTRHGLGDRETALRYARAISQHARHAPGWARQMHIFVLEDMGQTEAARILLGGLLASGSVTDPHEIAFLTKRLEEMQYDESSTLPSK